MEKISTKSKITAIILIAIVIIGMAIILTSGLNFELKYQNTQKVQLFIEKDFEISDIKQITDEVFANQEVIIQKAREFEDVAHITTTTITDEQKSNLITKINEKYGTELDASTIETITIPNTRGRDIIKPYIKPFSITTAIILVYFMIKYRKLGAIKILLKAFFWTVITQLVLLSIIAITRIPIGRLTIPMIITVYILTQIGITNYFDKKNVKEDESEVLQ